MLENLETLEAILFIHHTIIELKKVSSTKFWDFTIWYILEAKRISTKIPLSYSEKGSLDESGLQDKEEIELNAGKLVRAVQVKWMSGQWLH